MITLFVAPIESSFDQIVSCRIPVPTIVYSLSLLNTPQASRLVRQLSVALSSIGAIFKPRMLLAVIMAHFLHFAAEGCPSLSYCLCRSEIA